MSNQHEETVTGQKQDSGQNEDRLIPILVNGKKKEVKKGKISYETVVSLAYDGNPPSSSEWDFTVTYRRGQAPHEQGELEPGDSVTVVPNMIFNVTPTKKS